MRHVAHAALDTASGMPCTCPGMLTVLCALTRTGHHPGARHPLPSRPRILTRHTPASTYPIRAHHCVARPGSSRRKTRWSQRAGSDSLFCKVVRLAQHAQRGAHPPAFSCASTRRCQGRNEHACASAVCLVAISLCLCVFVCACTGPGVHAFTEHSSAAWAGCCMALCVADASVCSPSNAAVRHLSSTQHRCNRSKLLLCGSELLASSHVGAIVVLRAEGAGLLAHPL